MTSIAVTRAEIIMRMMIVHVIRAMLLSAMESERMSKRSNKTRTLSFSTATREPTSRYSK